MIQGTRLELLKHIQEPWHSLPPPTILMFVDAWIIQMISGYMFKMLHR